MKLSPRRGIQDGIWVELNERLERCGPTIPPRPQTGSGLVSNAVAAFVTERRTRSKELGIVEGAIPYVVHTVAAIY